MNFVKLERMTVNIDRKGSLALMTLTLTCAIKVTTLYNFQNILAKALLR